MPGYWNRIEPNNTTPDLELGLRASIADPLWMLCRQWQLGEFRGEDAASPVKATLTVATGPVTSFATAATARMQTGGVVAPQPLPRDYLLECRAEAEAVIDGPAALRLSADAGLQLARRLDAAGLSAVRAKLRAAFPLSIAGVDLSLLPLRQARELELLAARAIDGAAVAAAEEPLAQAGVPATDRPAARPCLQAWRAELAGRIREPEGGATWTEGTLDYRFSVAAATPAGEVVLSARHTGGHLDWYSFDVTPGLTHGLAASGTRHTIEAIPVPVQYRGMPASRFWQMEEGQVYFGDLAAGPADLARLVIAEFATVYGDDWTVVPVPLRCGSLARIENIRLIDTFGLHDDIAATAVNDGADRVFAMFELAGDPSPAAGQSPWLFVPTSVATSLVGRAVEEVSMVRDENANLAWGVERSFEGPTGRPIRRRLLSSIAAPAPLPPGDAWAYRLSTPIPPHWVPFVPEALAQGGVILRRGRMQAWDELAPSVVGAKGRFLLPDPSGPLRIREETVPRGGLELTRAWQLARGSDGEVYLWMSRQKRPGHGERGSGLEMDRIERSGGGEP